MQPHDDLPVIDDDEVDLRSYLLVLRRRWKVILGSVLACVVVAVVLTTLAEPTYRANADILVRQPTSSAVLSEAGSSARQLNNEIRLFTSLEMRIVVRAAYDGPLDPLDVDASVALEETDVIRASLDAGDPEAATELLDLYIETFIEWRRQVRIEELLAVGTQVQQKIVALDQEIAAIRAPLVEIETQLANDPGNVNLRVQRDELQRTVTQAAAPLERQRTFYATQVEDLQLTADIVQTSGARVLGPAFASDEPVSPQPTRNVVIALALGLMLGVALAFVFDTLDERIRGITDLQQVTGTLPLLAGVPVVAGHTATFVATRDDASGAQAEAFRSLRTSVKFASLEKELKVIQVTSASPGEGKTTVVANLAVAMAQGGDRVAVIGCDLRRPKVQERFGVPLAPGLTDVLVRDCTLADALCRYETNLFILPAGSPPPNPSELLSTNNAAAIIRALADEFDVVLVDSTPILPVTDALVVSRFADATIVVVDSRSTVRKAVRRSLQMLSQVRAPVIGVVLNGMSTEGGYGLGYGYGYGYGYAPEVTPEPKRGRARGVTAGA